MNKKNANNVISRTVWNAQVQVHVLNALIYLSILREANVSFVRSLLLDVLIVKMLKFAQNVIQLIIGFYLRSVVFVKKDTMMMVRNNVLYVKLIIVSNAQMRQHALNVMLLNFGLSTRQLIHVVVFPIMCKLMILV